MSSKKKVNPRRKPVTMADVDKMREVWKQTENLADSIGEGRVTIADLCCTLREEYDIRIL